MSRREPRPKSTARPDRAVLTSGPDRRPAIDEGGDESFARIGEGLRRLALGLVAILFVARAYYPSEGAASGTGLAWVLAVLATSGLAVASALFSGSTRLRWSWADAAVLALIVLVAASASNAADRRPAITMAWEWGALGLLYFLARNLPRTRGESQALAGAVVATAVAVAAYGLYQVPVEFAQLRAMYLRNPDGVLRVMGIEPGTPSAESARQRLLFSNEPFSTFALANSLAGFLVGPMALAFAVALENLRREGRGSRFLAFGLAAVPGLVMLACLVLTKSRSAYVGLFVALLVLAWRARGALPGRVLVGAGVGLVVLVGALVTAGVATKQLDVQVLTESTKSLRYRWEYWVGAWGVITDAPSAFAAPGLEAGPFGGEAEPLGRSSGTFWSGVGPANFAMPYLRHKLPEASEEVKDPHNLVLEVWTTAGFFAMLALLAAIGLGLRETLGPARGDADLGEPIGPPNDRAPGSAWLVGASALGWLAAWPLGGLNPVSNGDLLARWLILGAAWGLAVLMGSALWRRRPIPAAGLGVGVLAVAINLLAAGGIGIPSVAMGLWLLLALGQNLREDRPCGRLREVGGLGPAVVLACVWAGLAGTFYGAVMPYWQSESLCDAAEAALASRPPAYEAAREGYERAIEADHYNVRPWLGLAEVEYAYWRSPEVASRKEPRFMKPLIAMDGALDPKWRDPANLGLRRRQAELARMILRDLRERTPEPKPNELLPLLTTIVKANRWAARIYPTSAARRADLARSSSEIGMYAEAAREAKQALLLDGLTPHADKKLPAPVRAYLESRIPEWEAKAKEPPPKPPGRPGGARP